MKATITIDKKDALLAGLNNEGKYDVEFDPADLTKEEREELAGCFNVTRDVVPKNVYPRGYTFKSEWKPALDTIHKPVAPTVDEMRKVLNDRIRVRKELEKIEVELARKVWGQNVSRAVEWAESPPEKRIEHHQYMGSFTNSVRFPVLEGTNGKETMKAIAEENPVVKDAIDDAESLAFWLNLERSVSELRNINERAKKEAEEKAEKEASMIRRKAQIDTWVAEHGDENMKERHAAGLLLETEVVDAIRNQAYAALDKFPRYARLKASDVCNGYEDYDGKTIYHDVDFSVMRNDIYLDAQEFDRMKEIRAAAPEHAVIFPRKHYGRCDECDETVIRTGFLVTIKVGELSFSREYAATDESE